MELAPANPLPRTLFQNPALSHVGQLHPYPSYSPYFSLFYLQSFNFYLFPPPSNFPKRDTYFIPTPFQSEPDFFQNPLLALETKSVAFTLENFTLASIGINSR